MKILHVFVENFMATEIELAVFTIEALENFVMYIFLVVNQGNKALKSFFARARGIVEESKRKRDDLDVEESKRPRRKVRYLITLVQISPACLSILTLPYLLILQRRKSGKKQPKFGNSMLTSRILGPSDAGQPGSLSLPWSCAIYSIVNWMVAFSDVEGIQVCRLELPPGDCMLLRRLF